MGTRLKKPTKVSRPDPWDQRYPKAILVVVTLACLLPFVGKAFHIDDPLFVWAGRQMQTRWWDPYGFQVNWYGVEMPMHQVTKNPPLACAFIALIISIFGENEIALHLGFFIQAIAVVLGTYALARRFCGHPIHAALATLFTPVFMVSSTTLMCDVLMIALWVWAVEFWMRGLENNRPLLLVLAAFLVGACSVAKYFGIALVPVLFVYSLMRKGRPGWWLVCLLVPLVIIASYEGAMRALYGHGLMWDASIYAKENRAFEASAILFKVLTTLGFIGGGCAIVLMFPPVPWRSKLWLGIGIVALALLPTTWILLNPLPANTGGAAHLGITLLWTVFILGGLVVLALPILEWRRQRNEETLMLLFWVWGTCLFCILNWTINARSVLPMVPAVMILWLRQTEFVRQRAKLGLNVALGVAAVLSLLVSLADYRLANSARTAAGSVRKASRSAPSAMIWFEGHWGFQYYALANGMRAFDLLNPQARSGDLIVLPLNNTNVEPIAKDAVEPVGTLSMPVLPGIATMNRDVGAGFYTDIKGPLPFSFGAVSPERYYIVRFR